MRTSSAQRSPLPWNQPTSRSPLGSSTRVEPWVCSACTGKTSSVRRKGASAAGGVAATVGTAVRLARSSPASSGRKAGWVAKGIGGWPGRRVSSGARSVGHRRPNRGRRKPLLRVAGFSGLPPAARPRRSHRPLREGPFRTGDAPLTPMSLPRCLPVFALLLALQLPSRALAAAPGAIAGAVSNAATRNLLPGARIELPALGREVLADDTGRYELPGVPAGRHELLVSYIGLDAVRRVVEVGAGQRVAQDFELTTAIYRMDQFKVVGEREGDAAAITAQRNADNVRNVVAADSFGNLPNLNAAEVAIRLPGIAGNPDDGGTYTGFTIRGMGPGLNAVTLDGGPLTGQGGMARNTMLNNFSGTMLEQIELIKGHT
ncbi:MAG: hypothetical protein FJ397_14985, partial [Verrucomicrobia bacterium]|nr:hypothetical protein [Verrucomicrobiota bacterium]